MKDEVEFYSQNGEDFLLWSLFSGRKNGFYIDIGAFDGVHLSNSCYFEKNGWGGVCVEAHPGYFPLCEKSRPNADCIGKACTGSSAGSTVTFNAEELGLFSGILTEEHEAVAARYERRNTEFTGYKKVEVGTITLNEIIQKYAPADKRIDFISMDTEGTELEILQSFDFDACLVTVFIVEANDERHARNLMQLMQSKGYVLARVLQHNLFFAKLGEVVNFLTHKRIACKIANVVHPLGEKVTRPGEQGRVIEDNSRWITPNVLSQLPAQPLWSLLDYFPEVPADTGKDLRLVHMINPYPEEVNSESGRHQQATCSSMCAARDFDGGDIELVSIQHQDDPDLTPDGFKRGQDLDRTVADINKFSNPQPLPLIFDILERGAEQAEVGEYIIYTNSDIVLMPHFYSAIRDFIGCGFDAINICRRTIGDHALYVDHRNFARSDIGDYHPGSDCFVFSKKIYDQFIPNNSCIGKLGMPQSLLCNMAASAQRMLVLRNVHLTYHLGDDRNWMTEASMEYKAFNEHEFEKTRHGLNLNPAKRQRLHAFIATYWQRQNMFL